MWKWMLMLMVCGSSAAFGAVVDKEKFLKLTEDEIWETDESKKLLCDSFDAYTYYYLNGKIAGILEARRMFEEAQVRSQSSQLSTQ